MEEDGQEFSFLKRTCKLTPDGLLAEETYGKVKRQRLPASADIQDADSSNLVGPQEASAFRSITGMGIYYLAQERLDIAYTTKELASKPHGGGSTEDAQAGGLSQGDRTSTYSAPKSNQRRRHQYPWIFETCSDADWSGCKATRRSTSSAIHAVNGLIMHSSSRGQKTISLSSAESELNALVAAACDGICLKDSLEFLTQEEVEHVCWVDNSATRQIARKRGSGKLRHLSGKLPWCQDKVADGSLSVRQVGTTLNIADIGAKPLSRARVDKVGSFALLVQCYDRRWAEGWRKAT